MTNRTLATLAGLALALLAGPGCRKPPPPKPKPKRMAKPTLQSQLDVFKRQFVQSAPKERVTTFQRGIDQLRASGILEKALKVGDAAPDFTLPNAEGQMVGLAALLEKGPVVLTWYRGGWCPYCNLALHAMQSSLPEMKKLGATLVAISPQMAESTTNTARRNRLKFEVLSDVGNKVARKYGLVYRLPDDVAKLLGAKINLEKYNGDLSQELPLAATYVVAQDGTIAFAHVAADYRVRAEPADVVAALKRLKDGE